MEILIDLCVNVNEYEDEFYCIWITNDEEGEEF